MPEGFAKGLRLLWPRAPKATIEAITADSDAIFAECEIDTPLRVAHFMAQISHECAAGTIVRENMNYSAERLMVIFGVGKHSAAITEPQAKACEHKPELIAERVYGLGNPKKAKELGNTKPGDGYRYRGNGMLQLTGRDSHKRIGEMIGVDLEENPEQLQDPAISFRVAAAEFKALKCLEPADADDVVLVTRRVNGGRNGLAERTVWLRKWKRALDDLEEPPQAPRGAPPEQPKGLMSTNIGKGGAIGGGLATVSAGAQIAQAIKSVSDTSEAAKAINDNTVAIIKPLVGLPISIILAVVSVAAVAMFAFVLWKRYRKLQDEGV